MLKIKDKVINNGLKGQIIDIKEANNILFNNFFYTFCKINGFKNKILFYI